MKRDDLALVYNACVTFAYAPQPLPPQSGRWSHNASGWSAKTKVSESPVVICAECGSSLHVARSKKAHVYGFRPTKEVRQVRKRRGKTRRGTRHWYNYRLVDGEKIYFDDGGLGGVICTNSSVGFDVTSLHYVQKLHFYGYVSFTAVAKSRAATFGSSAGSRFQAYLADAFFRLHAVTEFRPIKYDVRNITVGDEVA